MERGFISKNSRVSLVRIPGRRGMVPFWPSDLNPEARIRTCRGWTGTNPWPSDPNPAVAAFKEVGRFWSIRSHPTAQILSGEGVCLALTLAVLPGSNGSDFSPQLVRKGSNLGRVGWITRHRLVFSGDDGAALSRAEGHAGDEQPTNWGPSTNSTGATRRGVRGELRRGLLTEVLAATFLSHRDMRSMAASQPRRGIGGIPIDYPPGEALACFGRPRRSQPKAGPTIWARISHGGTLLSCSLSPPPMVQMVTGYSMRWKRELERSGYIGAGRVRAQDSWGSATTWRETSVSRGGRGSSLPGCVRLSPSDLS
jgi:hypothetical protein